MKVLKYGIICEDKAHYAFLTTFIQSFSIKRNLQIKLIKEFFLRFRASNSKEVLKKYPSAAIVGFRDYSLDLLIIGIDYDDRDRNNFSGEINALYGKLDDRFADKCVIMFPVQAIEHWLLYIQYHRENPKSTKNVSFESMARKEAKEKIYGKKYSKNQDLIVDMAENIDTDWLISRSESFKKFFSDLDSFFVKYYSL